MSSPEIKLPGETPSANISLRMIMSGKEVGPIIGKGGETINSIRDESGAKIYINDGSCLEKKYISDESCPERIITVAGTTDAICKAYTLICKKMEEREDSRTRIGSSDRKDGLRLRMVLSSTQCGSLIGKGGSRIKEIREVTGASVQVASDFLPGSTERSVTVAGSREAVTQCIYHICCVMLESPAKGTTVQYQPGRGGFGLGGFKGGLVDESGPRNLLERLLGLGGHGDSSLEPLSSIAGSQIRRQDRGEKEYRDRDRGSTYQMSVANELIGSVIGQGGSKIAKIRNISGTMIKISKGHGPDAKQATERQIQITGNPDSVALAKRLINMSLDLLKSSLGRRGSNEDDHDDNYRKDDHHDRCRDHQHDVGLASLLAKPEVLAAVNLIGQLGSLGGGFVGDLKGFGQMGGLSRRRASHGSSGRSRDADRRDSKRYKFAPY